MKILFCGDIVGRAGRKAVEKHVPRLKKELGIDLVIANVDNASGGFGINKNTFEELEKIGIDVMTGGDHVWDQSDTISFISQTPNLLRPLNFPKSTPGNGAIIFPTKSLKKILIIHLLGQVFIKNNLNCPFEIVEDMVKNYKLGRSAPSSFADANSISLNRENFVDAILIDIHAEATSEKMAVGKFLDGKVSAVVGSHTHIPTNDFHIMKKGTAYQTDAGMCGDYDSIIGMQEDVPLRSFLTKRRVGKMEPAKGEATFCATLIETDDVTGLAKKISAVKLDGILVN